MKINMLSNAPWAPTGYGCQARINAPRIKAAGHDISITAFYGLEGGMLNWGGIPIYPKMFHPYGQDIIGAHAAKADIMLSNLDAWVCEPETWPHLKWVTWFPIDHDTLPPAVRVKVEKAFHRITVSRFACGVLDNLGIDYSYVPYSIETSVFHPIDRKQARIDTSLPADAFIVGMVAMNKGNPSRKAFTQQIEAFAQFKAKRKDAVLYLHTSRSEHGENGGVNLPELCEFVGLKVGTDVLFPDRYQQAMGFPDEWMNKLYNSFDVKMLVSMGEGFGIPLIEAQAAGCPVITSEWTSMGELCFSGWTVKKSEAQKVWTPMGAYQFSPNAGAIVDRLEAAYAKKDNQKYRDRARAGALAYDADTVFAKYWLPALAEIQSKLDAPQTEQYALGANLDGLR